MNFPGTDFRTNPKLLRAYREECKQFGPEMVKVEKPLSMTRPPERTTGQREPSMPLGAWRSKKRFAVHWRAPNGNERLSVMNDPYHDTPVYHMAKYVSAKGVSALCFKKPRKIPETASWTIREEAVTCPKCLKILKTIP